ncbi:MotA/TolQ/ExbB proton channel family protein [bacterium]|nr:MotA/TolQ/ExbB proton channel family protein [candidate division CSSED10-310 bacterium]
MNAGFLAKIDLLIVLLFSLGSWGIMLDKYLQFSRLNKSSVEFMRLFKHARHLGDMADQLKSVKPSPLVRIFIAGYRQLERRPGTEPGEAVFSPTNTTRLDLALDDAIITEIQNLERRVTFLGTCGSITPFLGLFGTVWGIMTAFQGIGSAGSASIAAVAPGIAEALITTAAGLAAAIPAVMGYNFFLLKIRLANVMFERFRSSFLSVLE